MLIDFGVLEPAGVIFYDIGVRQVVQYFDFPQQVLDLFRILGNVDLFYRVLLALQHVVSLIHCAETSLTYFQYAAIQLPKFAVFDERVHQKFRLLIKLNNSFLDNRSRIL